MGSGHCGPLGRPRAPGAAGFSPIPHGPWRGVHVCRHAWWGLAGGAHSPNGRGSGLRRSPACIMAAVICGPGLTGPLCPPYTQGGTAQRCYACLLCANPHPTPPPPLTRGKVRSRKAVFQVLSLFVSAKGTCLSNEQSLAFILFLRKLNVLIFFRGNFFYSITDFFKSRLKQKPFQVVLISHSSALNSSR